MKTVLTLLFVFLLTTSYGQTDNYKVLLDSAKTLFKEVDKLNRDELYKFDYSHVVSLLEKAVELNPQSSEARYFLGYTYSRINSKDGQGMISMNLDLVYKSSEQFEKTIMLTPKYSDEIIILDTYSKITAEWGSMAMSYWHNNKADSAVWAFSEGKKRGGFGDFILDLNRYVLDACSKNSILISSGDNSSVPLWYLQVVENYRTDVTVVDISLLNSYWYPAFLSKNNSVSFDLPKEVLDTIEYTVWTDSIITINDFSWTVKPSFYNHYLLRGDRVFLSILKQNEFKRDVFFTKAFMEESRLSLKDYLSSLVLVDKISVVNPSNLTDSEYEVLITKVLKLSEKLNLNNRDEMPLFDNFRYDVFDRINASLAKGDTKKAKVLMDLLDKCANDKKYPYSHIDGKKYADYLRTRIYN